MCSLKPQAVVFSWYLEIAQVELSRTGNEWKALLRGVVFVLKPLPCIPLVCTSKVLQSRYHGHECAALAAGPDEPGVEVAEAGAEASHTMGA